MKETAKHFPAAAESQIGGFAASLFHFTVNWISSGFVKLGRTKQAFRHTALASWKLWWHFDDHNKLTIDYLTVKPGICLSVQYVINMSGELFILLISHMAGVLTTKCSVAFCAVWACEMFSINTFWSQADTRSLSWGSRHKLSGDGEKWVQVAVRIKQKKKLNKSGWVRRCCQHRFSILHSELDVRVLVSFNSSMPVNVSFKG